MTCPYLAYRYRDDSHEFDHDRPFCTAEGAFVAPVRADVCNDRFDFDHRSHCDVYQRSGRAVPDARVEIELD